MHLSPVDEKALQPLGDRVAKTSEEVPGPVPVVPRIVPPLPAGTNTRREELHLPRNGTVLCRYGAESTFNIDYAKAAVGEAVRRRDDL